MGTLVVLNQEGDIKIEWDPADADSTKKAKDEFDRLKKDGYEIYAVEERRGKTLSRFDKKAGKLLAAPGVKTSADKEKQTRPRAMAGGPNAQTAPLA